MLEDENTRLEAANKDSLLKLKRERDQRKYVTEPQHGIIDSPMP